jgi:hypothetical protein
MSKLSATIALLARSTSSAFYVKDAQGGPHLHVVVASREKAAHARTMAAYTEVVTEQLLECAMWCDGGLSLRVGLWRVQDDVCSYHTYLWL